MSFSYTVKLADSAQLPQDALILTDVKAALADWASVLGGLGAIDVQINVVPLGTGVLANCMAATTVFQRMDGVRSVFESGAVSELQTGVDPNGSAADVIINLNASLVGSSFWFNPTPGSTTAPPSNKYDALTVLRHELGHAFGINGFRSDAGALGSAESPFDSLVQVRSDGSAWFIGAHAVAVYGGAVPVTTLANGEAYYHFGNSQSQAASSDLMGGTGLPPGVAHTVTALDIAVMQDLGVPLASATGSTATASSGVASGSSPSGAATSGGGPILTGSSGDDVFAIVSGVTTVTGGAGLDTAVFSATSGAETITFNTGSVTVSGPQGTATLTGVERLHFTDKELALDVDGHAGQAYRLYQAALGRAPEQSGLTYWTDRLDQGASLSKIAAGFAGSGEFAAKIGGGSAVSMISLLYQNVLGRAADAGGLTYWSGLLATGSSMADILASFSESPENVAKVAPAIAHGMWLDV